MVHNKLKQASVVTDTDVSNFLHEWGYEKPCLIGQGAFAEVYRVKERATGRFVACKVSLEQEMLRKESSILQQIEHPLFPAFYDFGKNEGMGFLFMEYIPGTSLGTLMKRRGKMKQRQAIRIGMALAAGLCYLHELSTPVIFRDLKPENIVIREDGAVKLLDFGSAVRVNTSLHAITGTDGYAAPEQWTDVESVGTYSDVYALGKVMGFILGKKKGYRGLEMLLEQAAKEEIKERIPNMRYFSKRLRPYASENKWDIIKAECRSFFRRRESEYIFQQDIIKNIQNISE